MPPRVREIKHDIETALDYRGMREGRAEVYAYARQCGYEAPGELVLEWGREFQRTHRAGWIMSGARPEDLERYRISSAGRGDLEFAPVADLDHWSEKPDEPGCDPDDDPNCDPDDEAKRTKACPQCKGTGKYRGVKCSRCQGKGRVALDVDDVEERRGSSATLRNLDNWDDWSNER